MPKKAISPARLAIIEAIYYTRYVTVHNVRGFHYHAMVNLCELAGNPVSLGAATFALKEHLRGIGAPTAQ